MGDRIGMDLGEIVAVIKSRWWLIAAAALAAALLALVVSLGQPNRYTATADLLFGRTTSADSLVAGGTGDTSSAPQLSPATNVALASLDAVAARVKQRFRGGATVQQIKNAVSVEQDGQSDLVTVTAEWSTPADAAAIANAFASEIVALRRSTAQAEIQRAINALNARIARLQRATQAGSTGGSAAQVDTLQGRVSELEVLRALQTGNVQVVERAIAPTQRSSPTPVRSAVIAGVLGLLVGLFGVVLLGRFDQRVRDEDELVSLLGVPVLARIPSVAGSRRLAQGPTLNHNPQFMEAFQFLRLNLQLMGPAARSLDPDEHGRNGVDDMGILDLDPSDILEVEGGYTHPALRGSVRASRSSVAEALRGMAADDDRVSVGRRPVLAVTSPGEGDGKTTVVAWLAHSLATTGTEVVAVDLDLRHPMLHVAFDLPPGGADRGVIDALVNDVDARAVTKPTAYPDLHVMPGGQTSGVPSGLISRGRLRGVLEDVRTSAEYVLVDTSPVTTVADASAVTAASDGVILVVNLKKARRKDLLAAKQQLGYAHARILGVVINHAPQDFTPYHVPEPRRLEATANR